jgi:cytoskeletal protein RodZ
MQSIGQKLRFVREAQARTLEHVNASTRIPIKSLEAIEADDVTAISSAFLYRSFVRQLAEYLGIDYSELSLGVQEAGGRFPTPLMPGQGAIQPPKVAALPVGRKKKSRLLLSVSAFAAVLVACSGLYAAWQKSKVNLPSIWHAPSGEAKSPVQTGVLPDRASIVVKPTDSIVADINKSEGSDPNGFTLELSATEPAWLSIIADGKQSFDGILERAQKKVLEGHRTARVRAGNAGVVRVVFNGKALGPLGPRGQVRTVLFTKNNYEILRGPGRVSEIRVIQTAELKLPLDQPFRNF